MNFNRLFPVALALTVILGISAFSLASDQNVRAGPAGPTPAPTRTPGAPVEQESVYVPLAHPLTQEEAVARAFELDRYLAVWQEPWNPTTLTAQPERISVEWHADRSYEGDEYGHGVEQGPVWVISIKGPVQLRQEPADGMYHDGLSYRISQLTGNLFGYRAGPWVK